jgi:hypothetical protein
MDIDITDSNFALDVPGLEQVISNNTGDGDDYTMYIYIGSAVLAIIIGIFLFQKFSKFSQDKNSEQSREDCPGGFCTMNQNSSQI